MRADLCPVCKGTGWWEGWKGSHQWVSGPCHGCEGKGWVPVDGEPKYDPEHFEWNGDNSGITHIDCSVVLGGKEKKSYMFGGEERRSFVFGDSVPHVSPYDFAGFVE